MSQTKRGSLEEAITGTCLGFFISLLAGYIIYPAYKVQLSNSNTIEITLIFTVLSIARSYVIRRWFNGEVRIRILKKIFLHLSKLIWWRTKRS